MNQIKSLAKAFYSTSLPLTPLGVRSREKP